ncbi:hypothetical protein [Longispora urticae]
MPAALIALAALLGLAVPGAVCRVLGPVADCLLTDCPSVPVIEAQWNTGQRLLLAGLAAYLAVCALPGRSHRLSHLAQLAAAHLALTGGLWFAAWTAWLYPNIPS